MTALLAAPRWLVQVMMPAAIDVPSKRFDPRQSQERTVQRVLLADDDPVNRQLTARLLEARGCRVTAVDNGLDAVACHGRLAFDLVLLDVEMPGLDGPRTAERIRAAERASGTHVPIIALTAHRRRQERDRCLAAGMDSYLTKPFEAAQLDRLLAGDPAGRRSRPNEVPDTAEPVDWGLALASVNDDRQLLERLTASARRSAPEQITAARRALATADSESARRAAHTLRGALRIFGARRARDLAMRLEEHAAHRRMAAAADLLDPLATEVESVLRALAAGPPGLPPVRED